MMTIATPIKYFDVEIYSHHFVIKNASAQGQQVILNFAANFIQYELVKENRVWKRKGTRIFGARTACKNESRFHIGSYKQWLQHLEQVGIQPGSYTETTFGYYETHPIDVTFQTEKQPRDYQVEINKYNMSPLPSKRKFVGIKPGRGKAVKNGTPVRIPGGWCPIENLKAGDYVVASDGTITMVEGVYPQGSLPLYEIVFEDGRSGQFCGNHIWSVFDESRPRKEQSRDINTLELLELLKEGNGSVRIPLPVAEGSGTRLDIPIKPYLLAALVVSGSVHDTGHPAIGDCSESTARTLMHEILNDTRVVFSKEHNLAMVVNANVDLLEKLPFLASDVKKIPDQYLNAVLIHRRQLLNGLMDFGGVVLETDRGLLIGFKTACETLAKDVQYLARSLEGKACTTHQDGLYTVEINLPEPWQYFSDEEVSDRLGKKHSLVQYNRKLKVKSVTPVAEAESTCISINHPSKLFVVGDFIVTHNTFIAGWMAAQLGGRIVSFLKPEYLEKWPGDLNELLGIDLDDIEIVKGSSQLMAVISSAKEGNLRSKAVLVSNRTFQNYISLYEKHGDEILNMGYDCLPHEFCQVLGASLRIIDEVHRDFHCNFKIDLYTHIEWSISLTATLISDDDFITKMHEIAYPKNERSQVVVIHKYVRTNALRYRIYKPDKLRTSEFGSTNYSHIAFEKNFFKNDRLMRSYMNLINDRFGMQYLIRKQAGHKCLIYAASIKMCTQITDYLQEKYPELKIRRFVENDPYENLMESDVAISTIGSAGTGHDIKNLITVLLTTAIASTATNIQGFGRLRDIPGFETLFEYFTCMDIAKHMDYHFKKEILLKIEALVTGVEDYPHVLQS